MIKFNFFYKKEKVKNPWIKKKKEEVKITKDMIPEINYEGEYKIETLSEFNAATWQYTLNATMYRHFFKDVSIQGTDLFTTKGLLDKNKNNTLSLVVTDSLTLHQWERLLEEAKKVKCKLNILVAPNVHLPLLMQKSKKPEALSPQPLKWNFSTPLPLGIIQCIETSDEAFTIHLMKEKANAIFFVSEETSSTHLFENIECLDSKNNVFQFSYQIGRVTELLMAGKTIILTGTLSKSLMNFMESLYAKEPYLLINGEKKKVTGHLILIASKNPISSLETKPYKHVFNPDDIWMSLQQQFSPVLCEKLKKACLELKITPSFSSWE